MVSEQSQRLLSDIREIPRMFVGSGLALCTLQNAPFNMYDHSSCSIAKNLKLIKVLQF